MSVESVLTVERLRDVAGFAFDRGHRYWKEGRVVSGVREGDTLDGVVEGGERYRVRVFAGTKRLSAECTCPVGTEVCKHAVALGLSYLAQQDVVAAPPREEPREFASRAEADAFVAAHQIQHALALSAECLWPALGLIGGNDAWLRSSLTRLALRDVSTREGAARFVSARGIDGRLAEAARARLVDEAEAVRAGIAEEAERPNTHGQGVVATLWGKLLALRESVRAHAVPRGRQHRTRGAWAFDPQAVVVAWSEKDKVVRTSPDYGVSAISTRLASTGGDLAIECACKASQGRCTHALALLDATLDVLADPARTEEATLLGTELLRPPWSRALVELAGRVLTTAKAPTPIEVWWQLEEQLGSWTLTPIVKRQTQRGKQKGAWTSGARISAVRLLDDHRDQLGERDLLIAEYLAAWAPGARSAGAYPQRAFVSLVGHPRVTTDVDPDERITVQRHALGFAAQPNGDVIRLEPVVDGERLSPRLLAPLLRVFAPGEPLLLVEPERQRCLLIDVSDEARRMWSVLERHGDAFPPESHTELLDRLAGLERKLPVEVPQALKGRELGEQGTTVIRLRLLPDVTLEAELFVRPAEGAPLFHPGDGPRDVMILRDGERVYVRRDLGNEEKRARAAMTFLPFEGATEGPPNCFQLPDPEAALLVVSSVQAGVPAGLEVEWVETRPAVGRRVGVESLRVHVERKRDWFGIKGDLKIEHGRLELAVVLDAVRRQQRFVRVDDNRWVELADTLRAKLQPIADQAYPTRHALELSPGAAPAVQALVEAGASVETAADWRRLTERMLAATAMKPKQPRGLSAILRDYQKDGYAWLARLAEWGTGGVLADDMGLGKTVQAIALLVDRARQSESGALHPGRAKDGPALVIAPTSVTYNWENELARFAPGLRPVIFADQGDRAAALNALGPKDVLIASYGLLVRDAELLASRPFSTLVLDEAQALKNPTTLRAKAARRLVAGFRVALSGTPLENHLGELWSLYAIVFPGLLGSWEQFRDRFATTIERSGDPAARAALARVLRPFLLRRTKAEVAQELPPRTEVHVPIALSSAERALYEDARLAAVAELGAQGKNKKIQNEQQRFQVLAALTRLRMLASHPKLYDATSDVPSSKLRRLRELVEELRSEGHRALVFSQFTSHLALVRQELEAAGVRLLYLDGSTTAPQRAKLIDRFQQGDGEVFLISLKAGGTGINLTAADYVIHLDPWWNPAVEDQATDRAHRIGQDKPVTVYRLVARGTIEESILAMHADKRALVAGVLEGSSAAAKLSTSDLMNLLTS